MCFIVGKDQIIQVATEEIDCFKLFKDPVCYSGIPSGILRSPYQNYDYKKGKRYDLGKELEIMDVNQINEGFHSYINLMAAEVEKAIAMAAGMVVEQVVVVVKCTIPKGSKYYVNPIDKEYVSDSIIIGTEFIK